VVARRPGGPRDVLSALLATFTGRKIATSTASLAASAEALGRETIAADLGLESVVQKVTDAGVTLTGTEFGAFFYNVIDHNGESYTLYTISGVPRDAFSKFPMPRNTHVFGPTFRGEAIVRSDDITKDGRYGKNPPYNGMPEGHLPVRSYLAIPVVSRSGKVIGGLFFGRSKVAKLTNKHEHLLSGMASQAAVAIDNARLYDAAQKEIERRRKAEKKFETAKNDSERWQILFHHWRGWLNKMGLESGSAIDGTSTPVRPKKR